MGLMCHGRVSELIRRLLAAGCIALVLALGLFAASPNLHEQLHHNEPASWDDGCAIVLFAHGLAVPLAVIAVPFAPTEWREHAFVGLMELSLESPRYRLHPGRGPPVA